MDIVRETRAPDALRWTTVGALAVITLVCSVLPAAQLEVSGFIGAGETQRVYDLQRDVALVPDLLPRSLLVVLPALALLGTAIAALVYGSRRCVAVIAFAAGLTLAVACFGVEMHFTFIGEGTVVGCDTPCAGFALLPAVNDLRDDLRSTPAGRRPGFDLSGTENSYYAKPHAAWWGVFASGLALGLLGGFALARLALSPWRAAVLVAAAAFLVLVWLVLSGLNSE